MGKRVLAKVAVVSYNFNTKESISKEFVESSTEKNPINAAEQHMYKVLNHTHTSYDGWQHKIFANKKAEQLRRKVWNNLDNHDE